jgi:hypothetical protein
MWTVLKQKHLQKGALGRSRQQTPNSPSKLDVVHGTLANMPAKNLIKSTENQMVEKQLRPPRNVNFTAPASHSPVYILRVQVTKACQDTNQTAKPDAKDLSAQACSPHVL